MSQNRFNVCKSIKMVYIRGWDVVVTIMFLLFEQIKKRGFRASE
jgi:hypothetical protein